jgi:hypothetical protein
MVGACLKTFKNAQDRKIDVNKIKLETGIKLSNSLKVIKNRLLMNSGKVRK